MIMRNDRYTATPYGDDDEAAAAEAAIWRAAPKKQKRYCDGPGHDSPEAEEQYRHGYLSAVYAVQGNPSELAEQIAAAPEIREATKYYATIGIHCPIFKTGHEVEAALTRGWHHGLIDCAEVFGAAKDADVASATLEAWLPLLKAWSDGDCSKFELSPAAPDLSEGR